MTTVTDLQKTGELDFFLGNFNTIDCDTRCGKTYWAAHNLLQFTRDNKLNRILYLVDTTALKNSLLHEYAEIFIEASDEWVDRWTNKENKIGIMCYQGMAARTINNSLSFLSEIDCICWDECDSIFDFAASAFAQARKTDFARQSLSNEEVLDIIQKASSKKEYAPLIFLSEIERIINEAKIWVIGLTATPERTRAYYTSLVYNVNKGKLINGYHCFEDVFFYNLRDHVKNLTPLPSKGYWVYSPFIRTNQSIVNLANSLGFHAIELHSSNNNDYPMTEEQDRVSNIIVTTGMVPIEYDFVIVNKAYERGFNIRDPRFEIVIIDSYDETERKQIPRQTFPTIRHLKTFAPEIPKEYLEKWLTVEECRELAENLAVMETEKSNSDRVMTWNKLKEHLHWFGYCYKTSLLSRNGKRQKYYWIEGEWKDAKIENGAFMALVAAKNGEIDK